MLGNYRNERNERNVFTSTRMPTTMPTRVATAIPTTISTTTTIPKNTEEKTSIYYDSLVKIINEQNKNIKAIEELKERNKKLLINEEHVFNNIRSFIHTNIIEIDTKMLLLKDVKNLLEQESNVVDKVYVNEKRMMNIIDCIERVNFVIDIDLHNLKPIHILTYNTCKYYTCQICLNNGDNLIMCSLYCNYAHIFCKDCLYNWIKTHYDDNTYDLKDDSKHPTCPTCRANLLKC
jgi:hypothetical protein